MKNLVLTVLLTAPVLMPEAAYAQPRPGNPTTSTVITKAEIDKIAATMKDVTTRDENARVVDIGDGWSMELGIIHRAKQRVMTVGEARAAAAAGRGMPRPPAVATPPRNKGPRVENRWPLRRTTRCRAPSRTTSRPKAITSSLAAARRSLTARWSTAGRAPTTPTADRTVRAAGGVAVGARKVELKVGDVLIVPPGVIHGWFDIPDHVDYLSFRPSHGIMKNGWVNPTIATK